MIPADTVAHDALAVAHINAGTHVGWFADCACGWRQPGVVASETAAQSEADAHLKRMGVRP